MMERSTTTTQQPLTAVIVGTGFGGIGMAIKLRQAGITDFVMLEESRPNRRHLAGQHLPRCGLRRPVAVVLVLVRAGF